jgi:hypothetical protein
LRRIEELGHQLGREERYGSDQGAERQVSRSCRRKMRDLGIHEDQVLKLRRDWTILSSSGIEVGRGFVLNAENKRVQLETRNSKIIWYLEFVELAP